MHDAINVFAYMHLGLLHGAETCEMPCGACFEVCPVSACRWVACMDHLGGRRAGLGEGMRGLGDGVGSRGWFLGEESDRSANYR